MISRVRGDLVRRDLDRVEVATAAGLTYEILIPLTVFERLPREGTEVELRTWQVVREDSLTLYGFLEERERQVFGRVMNASGVGPKAALAMLSTLSADRLARAIANRDIAALVQVQGIGRKKAEKIVVELADRMDDLAAEAAAAPGAGGDHQAVSALVALGYDAPQATAAVRKALDEEGPLEGTSLIKAALVRVGKK